MLAAAGEEDDALPSPDPDRVVEALSALRRDLEAQAQLIRTLHQPPPHGPVPEATPADDPAALHAEIMARIDQLIARIADTATPVAGGDPPGAPVASQSRPPPTGLSTRSAPAPPISRRSSAPRGAPSAASPGSAPPSPPPFPWPLPPRHFCST